MLPALVDFCRGLRKRGVKVTTSEILDALGGVQHIDLTDKEQFYLALRTSTIKNPKDFATFDEWFKTFWSSMNILETIRQSDENEEVPPEDKLARVKMEAELVFPSLVEEEEEDEEGKIKVAIYSSLELSLKKVFPKISREDVPEIKRNIRRLRRRLATKPGLRSSRTSKGEMDFAKSLRKSLQLGGEVFRIFRRKKRLSKLKVVVLCDVSGSMESYSEYLLKILYFLKNNVRSSEVFIFSTGVFRLTEFLSGKGMDKVTQAISEVVKLWGSGTKIGYSLGAFNKRYGNLVDKRTLVIVISDGWDVGEAELLRNQLTELKRKARMIIWLNPLADHPDYQPLTLGMQIALPYLDIFASTGIFKDSRLFERYLGKTIAMAD